MLDLERLALPCGQALERRLVHAKEGEEGVVVEIAGKGGQEVSRREVTKRVTRAAGGGAEGLRGGGAAGQDTVQPSAPTLSKHSTYTSRQVPSRVFSPWTCVSLRFMTSSIDIVWLPGSR